MQRLPNYNPAEHMPRLNDLTLTRREWLGRAGMGMGALSLAMMMGQLPQASGAVANLSPLAPKKAPLPAKAKHVIHIFAEGGPSHVDTWDPKPELSKYEDKVLPGLSGVAYPTPFKFNKYGQSGLEISELFSKLGEHADEMCVIRSMYT